MKIIHHLKQCSTFWKPSVARKITLYFTVFGLLIFYLTSVAYLIAAKKQLLGTATRIVQSQISNIPGSQQADFWWHAVDQKQPELRELAELLLNLSSSVHTITDVSIYTRGDNNTSWHRMRLDENDVLKAAIVDDPFISKLEDLEQGHLVHEDADLYVSRQNVAMFVNITSPQDSGKYYVKIDVARQGVTCIMGSKIVHFIGISFLVLIILRVIGYVFARRLAAPVEMLSATAERVAKGDLSVQVPEMGKTEIGVLGENFNRMIHGLREWQRIKKMEVELERGREIQQDFLPNEIPHLPDWDIATCFYPAREVSGDFYDVFDLPGGLLGLVIADVCDKGVGSALYMALIRSLIRVYAEQTISDGSQKVVGLQGTRSASNSGEVSKGLEAVRLTNNYLIKHHGQEGMFATLFFGVLDPDSGTIFYINGGHEPLYVIGADGVKSELAPTGPAVGLMENIPFKVQQIQLGPGDLLLGLTDGVTEARSPEDELFTRQRLRSLLAQPVASSQDLLERIRQQLFDFIGKAPRLDDVTMLAVQRTV